MVGDLDVDHGTAAIDVWIDGVRSSFVVEDHTQSPTPDVVAQQSLNAIVLQDWATLYGLLPSDVQGAMNFQAFSQRMADPSTPVIIAASLTGEKTIRTSQAGFPVYTRPFALSARGTDGVVRSYTSAVLIAREDGQWRFLGTDPPGAA